MADGQITTFDDLNKSLAQYRVQKQPKPVQTTALQPPPKAPSVTTTAAPKAPATPKAVEAPKPPKEATPKVLSFDSLTKDINARRAQTGMQPVKPVEPKVIQLSPEEKGRQLTETGERALAWQQRQSERLGDFVASKMTATPEEIKKTLDNTPAWQVHLAHALFSPGTKYDETQYRREAQAGLELEQKLVGWADKKVVEFFTDPVNVAFMTMTGGTWPMARLAVDGVFTAMMAKGAYQGFHNAYNAGKAANWDVFAHVGADGHLEAKPEAAPFWESLGDASVASFFTGMGLISTPHQVGLVREYGKFNDSKITGIDKRWSDMSQSDKARALANIQRQQTESGKDTVQHYQDLAHQFGLKPTPKDQAEAAAQFADATRETRERLAQAQRHMDALAKADATIAGAPEKAHRDVGTAVPELPPDESGSPESREALRKLQMGEELTPAEKAIGERERVRSQILLNLEPEQTAGLSDKDFQRWSRQYSQEEIVDGDDLLKLVKSTVARGDIDGAERSLKRGIRWSSEDPSEIPDDVADTPSEKREKAKANAERNTKLRAKIAEAERIVERAKTAKKYELAPVPVLGEMSVPTKSKIWTPEGEREITVMKPVAAEAGNRDLAVLNPSDREYARQRGRERDARAILEAERQRRQQEYVRKAQQAKDDTERQRTALQDSIKRTAEERVKAAESGLKVEEKRPLRFRTEEAARFGEMERQLSDQMSEVANRNMFVTPEQYLRFLRRPNRDQPLTEDERDFLRMDEERKILQHYQDPANLAPVATGVGAAVPPTVKPNVPTMRDRLEGVTNADEARQVLDGADDSQLAQLMNPLNRNLRGTGVVYGRAGERPMFTDSRGELHEGSSWTPHQGVDVVATVPVHPDDLPKWAIPGMDKKFVLQVAGQGDGVFGAADYTAPQIVVGQVDPAAQRGNWDWTDWAAMESKRRDDAFMNELEAIDRQNELENASIELGQQARRAGNTPEQAEQLEKDAQEADEMAKAIIEERNREEARNQPPNFPEAAPVKELGRGRETEIALPNGRRLKAHYALVSLDNVIASHLPNRKFEPNDKYIGWNDAKTMSILQPNDYFKNVPRQDETKYRAANPDFGQIFNTSSTGDQGPPVLRRDGIVAGGNNRTMVMEMLYASGRGNEVVNAINATKDQFGITEATPPFEDSPAIVRVLDEPMESREELITLGQQLNRDQMTKRNAAEDAAATALHFTPDFMDWIAAAFDDMDDEASLRDFMTKYATQIADKYEQYDIISHTERGQFIDENKEINPAGKLKFENAVRGVVIQDPASLAVLQEPGLRAQARAIDRALPGLLRMTAKGGIWDIHDYLPGAIRHWESINDARDKLDAQIKTAKEHGQKGVSLVDVYLYPERVKGTTRGFDFAPERPKLDPITEALMRLMELKPAEMKEAFNNYSLDAEGIHAQTNLLAEPLLPWASFDKHIGSKVGVEVQESDWGRIEAKPSEKPVEAAAVPPKVEAVQPEQKFKKGSTQTDIPAESEAAKSLEAARQRISDADLAGKGKDVGGNHVTVRYGIEGDDTGGIRDYLRSQRPFDALLGKTEKFKPTEQSEGAAVIQAPIDAPELHRINEELAKHGQFMKPTFDYKPHATVAYVKPEAADRYVGMDVTEGKTFRVDSVTISYRDGSTEEIKLEGRPESLQAPPKPPLAATPEAGGLAPPPPLETPMNEESLRTMLADHPGITPAQREGMIQVWKAFAEKYQGVPFDQWIRDKWKGVKVGGEYKGQEGLQQGSSAAVTWAYHPQKGILTDRAGRKAHDQLLREAGVDHMVGRAFDQMPRGKAMVDPYSHSLVVTLQGDGDLTPAAERELRSSLDVPSGYETRVNHASLFQEDKVQPVWYSKLRRTVNDPTLPAASGGDQWLKTLENKGVKRAEIEATGLDDFLKGKKKVTRDELNEFVKANQVEVKEVLKGSGASKQREDLWGERNDILNRLEVEGYYLDETSDGFDIADAEGHWLTPEEKDALPQSVKHRLSRVLQVEREFHALPSSEGESKYGQYTLPGGENYRELLLTLPSRRDAIKWTPAEYREVQDLAALVRGDFPDQKITPEQRRRYDELQERQKAANASDFTQGHFSDTPNVLAHVRFNDRTDADGKRVLFVEELQSDWHQKGRKQGYGVDQESIDRLQSQIRDIEKIYEKAKATGQSVGGWSRTQIEDELNTAYAQMQDLKSGRGRLPDAPWKKDWHELALRRMLRYAAENGYDKIAWTTGEQQAERYDLSKRISKVEYNPSEQALNAYGLNGDREITQRGVTPEKLADYIGKDAAEKLLKQPLAPRSPGGDDQVHALEGVDLKVGGSGMKGFYDKIVPDYLNHYGKKFGAKVGTTEFTSGVIEEAFTEYDTDNDSWTAFWRDAEGKLQHLTDFDNSREAEDYAHKKSAKPTSAHALELTPDLRKAALQGQPLFQGDEKVVRGLTEFTEDGTAIMHLFEQANFSTFAHESFHIMRRYLKPGDLAVLEKHLKVKDGAWTAKAEEDAARSWERYLRDGEAPTPELKTLFAKLRAWMSAIYAKLKGTPLDIKVSDDVRKVFDRMLTGEKGPEDVSALSEPPKEGVEKQEPSAQALDVQPSAEPVKELAPPPAAPEKPPRKVSKAAREKAEEEDKRIREFFTPGNVVLHGGTYDKVLEYIPGDPSKPYPANNWQARVIESDAEGNPKPGARERVHATPPDRRDKVVKTAPVQELDKAPEPPTSRQESGGSAEPALPGFEAAVAEQSEAAAAHRSEELAGEIAAPKGDISRATGEMESKSPLFRGTEASPQNEMFAPLSPEDAKDVQESLGLPDKLFQDDSPQARDMKLRMIRDKLKMPGVSGELRRKLEAMQAQLQGEPHGGTTPETPTGAGKRSAEPIQPPPTAPEAKREVKRETAAPKKTVKIWTPHGEIEVAREEPRREAPPKADAGRGAVDVADRDQRTRVPEPLSERPQPTTRSDTEPPAGRGVRPPAAGGRGRTRPGTGEESLPDVTPTRIAPPKRERGVPIYAPEQWKSKLELFRLPENMPVPFVALDSDIARLLIFPGQKELAESALSGLKQHDAYVLATSTGSGKTFLASAVVSQIVRREKPKNVLILTPSQNLVTDFKNVLLDFDVDAKSLPDGLAVPEQEGTYVTTFATANIRQGIETHPWDLVVMDEADAARRWYSSQQGAMAKKLGEHAGKVLYMSATPFHTALELGHMTKLGLWDNEGFDIWGKQFGIYRDKEGNYGGGNAPRRLVTLRQQLIERGQFAQLDRNMEGYYPHFLLAPLKAEEVQGLRNIESAFGLAKDYYARKGKKGLMRSLQGNMVVYMKSYLERTRLPQAIELAKRAEKEGYKAIIFSEHKTGRDELFSLLQEPDEHSDGEIKRLLPMIPDVVDELKKAFGDDVANFSGKHSTMRDEEKKAFIGNEKKHIYATYGAGGRGVSLHDTNGKYPRVAIYLGPPYSGVMLDQAIGRPWRFGTKSNVQAYFMLSNARDEVDLVIRKVAPRLESLRALVSGIDMTDPMTVAMRRLESAQDGAMGFDLGQEHSSNAGDLSNTYDNVPIMNWREAPMSPAAEQMNKGMRLPGETMPHPGISRLMQSEEYELPADMELPESTEAKLNNDERAEDFAQGNGASELTQGELQSIPAPERVQTAESVQTLAEAAAKDSPEAPRAAVRRTWDNAGKLLKAAQELPPSKAGRSVNWIWFTHGREIIRRSAARAGRAQLGEEMARDIARYHVETGNVAGPFQSRYYDIAKKLTPEEHDNMWLVKEGATRKNAAGVKVPVEPMNEKVVQAVKDTTKLLQDVKDLMAKERIYTEFYDEDTGRRVAVPFAEQVDDPRYMPHRYDYERKIQLVDPKTGAKETMTLREILNGKDLGQYKYERIVDALAADTGKSKAEIEDWLSRRRRDVPLVGNVERAREVDMPYYRTDPEAMIGYLEGAGEVVARQRIFGQDRMKLEAKLREIPNQRDRALIRDIFDSLLSRKQWDEDTRHFVNLAADWSVLSKMAFSAVKIPFHLLHSSLYTNGRTLLKTMFEGVTHPKEMRDRAIYSGAVMEQMRANLASELGMEKRFASKLLRWNLFHSAYSMDRALANASARIWMDDYALPKLKRDAQHSNARRQLKEVYLLGDNAIDKAAASGRWADEDYMRGGKALSDKVMFTFDPTELPPGWRARSNDPIADSALAAARVATLLKSFMFKTGVILKDRLWTEAKKGNFRPWLPFLAFYPVAGEAMRQLGGALTFNSKQVDWWQDPANQDAAKILERTAEDIGYTTGLTSLMWLLQAPLGQKGWAIGEFLAGPFYSDVMHTLYKFPSELAAAKSDYAAHNAITRWMTQTVPASRLPVRGYEEATGWDAEAEKKKAQKEAGHRAAQTRREHKYGNVKPL